MLADWMALVISWIPHEFGHYIGFRLFGFKPKIKVRWWGFEIGKDCWPRMYPLQAYLTSFFGILAGYAYLALIPAPLDIILIYFVMCTFDITNIFQILTIPKELMKRKLRLYEIGLIQSKEMAKKYEGG